MELKQTERGFLYAEFKDGYRQPCSIQQSSAYAPCIWLGLDAEIDLNTGEVVDDRSKRMHLTQAQVKDLLPLMEAFARTGRIDVKVEEGE